METKQYYALFSLIWNIANDVLVHAFEKGDYKKIILPFMVLRRIDVLLEPTKQAVLQKKEFCDQHGITDYTPVPLAGDRLSVLQHLCLHYEDAEERDRSAATENEHD